MPEREATTTAPRESRLKFASRLTLGFAFIAAGANHFIHQPLYVRIMPPCLPAPELMVQVSGIAEITLGASVLYRPASRPAGYGLIALLLAVFPANLHMALHPEAFPEIPRAALWARLPLQAFLIAWAWWHTRAAG